MEEQQNIRKAIFVYGTLKPGHSYVDWNLKILDHKQDNAKFFPQVNYAILRNYQIYLADYPLLIQEEGKDVHGFVLQVKDEVWDEFLKECDIIEDYPGWYDRKVVNVEMFQEYQEGQEVDLGELKGKKGEDFQAMVYLMNQDKYDRNRITKIGSNFTHQDYINFSHNNSQQQEEQAAEQA